ncbi:hypothetical protein ABEB36_014862 [Hypothenemus hampei]|uniref:Histone-lysine N-methyltransferase EHMT1 n=1 Tax=Hypothenemus hampei TaxID=57062 RepID=A0ABD1E135_HYPHA
MMEESGKIDILSHMKNNFNNSVVLASHYETSNVDIAKAMPENQEDSEGNALADKKTVSSEVHSVKQNSAHLNKANHNKTTSDEPVNGPSINCSPKRTSRRVSNKSVLQNAIARKEKSLLLEDKPRIRHKRIKARVSAEEVNNDPSQEQPKQKTNKSNVRSVKRRTLPESETEEVDKAVRKSPRSLPSESKKLLTIPQEEVESKKGILVSQLCKCTENKQLFMESELDTQFCMAVDSISGQLIGCSKEVNIREVSMVRPSVKIPFGVFCQSHKERLIRHNCCPICGVFCSQGNFLECKSKHYFHKDCILSLSGIKGCPHCGDSSPNAEIIINMHKSKNLVFLPVQRSHHCSSRITFNESKCGSNSSKEISVPPLIPIKHLTSIKNISNLMVDECNHLNLVKAIENDDSPRVAAILEMGNIDLKTKLPEYNNGSFLHFATLKAHINTVFVLVCKGIDLDALDADQNTALTIAILEHKNDIVQYLIKSGSDIKLKGLDGMTCLHMAAKSGNLEACKIILRSNTYHCDFVNIQDDGGWTSLVWACEHGHLDVVKFLISQGANINLRDVEYNVALHWAAFKGSSDIIELLLNLNSDINVLNVHGDSPLHISAREDHYNCVIILLSRQADISIINKNNETPLDCVPQNGLCYTPLALNHRLRGKSQKDKCLLNNDITRGRENNPIQCYNVIDSDQEPRDYIYVRKSCLTTDKVEINTKVTVLQSCTCTDRCKSLECSCTKLSLKNWYDDEGKLLSDFNFDDPPLIFECNDLCMCNSILCSNRLVQKPLLQRFELFKTATKGWGIKALNFIAKGSYVCEYVGEILTDLEAEHRDDDSYLFDLDNREMDSYCIDAKFYGNFARFINHSCAPNLHPVKVFIEHQDLRFPRIAFFSKRDIEANEELSFDYGDKFWLVKYKSFTCDCGAVYCKYSKNTIGKTLAKYQVDM